jgi:hypothetical protein
MCAIEITFQSSKHDIYKCITTIRADSKLEHIILWQKSLFWKLKLSRSSYPSI